MASQQFYLSQIKRLVDNYGEYYYRPERVKLMFPTISVIPDDILEDIVSEFIRTKRFAPLELEFKQAIIDRKIYRHYQDKQSYREEEKFVSREYDENELKSLNESLAYISKFLKLPEEEKEIK